MKLGSHKSGYSLNHLFDAKDHSMGVVCHCQIKHIKMESAVNLAFHAPRSGTVFMLRVALYND
jgi:hypothetical protein